MCTTCCSGQHRVEEVDGVIAPAAYDIQDGEKNPTTKLGKLQSEVEQLRAAILKLQNDTTNKRKALPTEPIETQAYEEGLAVSKSAQSLIGLVAQEAVQKDFKPPTTGKPIKKGVPEDLPVRGHSMESGVSTKSARNSLDSEGPDGLKRAVSKMDGEDDVSSLVSQRSVEEDGLRRVSVSVRGVMSGKRTARSMMMLCFRLVIYMAALAFLFFILLCKAYDWADDRQNYSFNPPSLMMTNISYCIAAAGLVAFTVNLLKQPLILGYLLGGVLIGKECGLGIVQSHKDISDFSSLGLVFLLFMIGLELDLSELAKMGKVVIFTGLLQFPICAGLHIGLFTFLGEFAGLSFGNGEYATLYTGMTCGISSTMIVVKVLSELADVDSTPGRLTIGILIFQDIWAIIVLAVQPDLANPQPMKLLKTFAMIAVLLVVAMLYAKFVMPTVFLSSSKHVELMLVLSLAWCFFMGCFAILPFVGLSLELASLISGVALATFPYSAEFNGKIKYIRDFFITLFFVGLGMQIPVPDFETLLKAALVAIVVLSVRWIGIFFMVYILGGGKRLAAVATINLSQISEFALVICSLGQDYEHVEGDTLTILIWTFALLAVMSSYTIGYNYAIYGALSSCVRRLMRKGEESDFPRSESDEGDAHADRNIIILGFHKVAAMLVSHCEQHSPHLLRHMHVICSNEEHMVQIKKKGVACSYGDISSPDVLEHAFHGEARLVVCSIPDSLLPSVTKTKHLSNMRLLQVVKQVWKDADVIVSADHPQESHRLYSAGADYVLRLSKLSAIKLSELTEEHLAHSGHHLTAFHGQRKKDEADMPKDQAVIPTTSISGRI